MLDKNTIIRVTNRDNGKVGYTIPDLGNLHREYSANETKEVTMDELRKLSYLKGGNILLKKYFVLDNPEAVAELLGEVEPEYYYSEKEIEKILLEGTIEQFEDCLDFAPAGVLDILKQKAVELKLNDVRKREILRDKLKFNVTTAIEANRYMYEDGEAPEETKKRRTAAPISLNKYDVIKK